jgi:hypothetical protein
LNVLDVFEAQAKACAELGSPFTAMVLRCSQDLLTPDTPIGHHILNWLGDPSIGADSVPLRLSGALHALDLTEQCPELMAEYPPNTTSADALQSAIRSAFVNHEAPILHWLKSAPQTNESARSAPLVASGHLLAAHFKMPLRLLELGTSAGLNLRWDHVAVDLGARLLGPKDAAMILRPDWQGDLPKTADLAISHRAGIDLNPLDATRTQDRLRLMSYVWPDQFDRMARMRQALELATDIPAQIEKGDAIDWLELKLAKLHSGTVTTVFHTIAWQYFPRAKQLKGKALIEKAGEKATQDAPLAWLSMENDNTPPGAVLTLRLWPGNHTITLGRADFHGRWVRWDAGESLTLTQAAD